MAFKGISKLSVLDRRRLGLDDPPALLQNCGWVLLGLVIIVVAAFVTYGSLFWIAGAVVR